MQLVIPTQHTEPPENAYMPAPRLLQALRPTMRRQTPEQCREAWCKIHRPPLHIKEIPLANTKRQ